MDTHLFSRVPPEVWSLIFDNFWFEKDFTSLHSCYITGIPAWTSILKKERTSFLFPLIISNLSTYISINQLLPLRLISSTWKSSTDTFLHSPTFWETSTSLPPSTPHLLNVHEPEDEWFRNGLSPPAHLGPTFWLPSQIDLFLTQFSNYPPTQNPFPTRTIKLIENEDSPRNSPRLNLQLYQKFEKLLDLFGNHIWKCVYYCDGSIPEANHLILTILRMAPNLNCLTIKKTYFWGEGAAGHNDSSDDEENDINESLKWLKRPLPQLPQLKSLNLFMDSKQLANSFLSTYAKQLISLQLELDSIENIPYFNEPPILKNSLKNLKSIKIFGYNGDSSYLNNLSQFNLPNLQRLSLNYNEVGRRALNFKSVFRLINKTCLSLQQLRMPFNMFGLKEEEIIRCYQEDKEEMGRILSKVKWLGVPYAYLEFPNLFQLILQKFVNLEHLHFMNYDKYCQDKQVERREFEENLSPFWGKDLGLRSLKKITVEHERTLKIIFSSFGENTTNYYNSFDLIDS